MNLPQQRLDDLITNAVRAGRPADVVHWSDGQRRGGSWLVAASAASFAVAALHVAITFAEPDAYEYFGAPRNLVSAARRGSAVPALVTMIIALVCAGFGLYGLSGAGRAPRLPALRVLLVGISGVYLLRGVVVVPEFILYSFERTPPGPHDGLFADRAGHRPASRGRRGPAVGRDGSVARRRISRRRLICRFQGVFAAPRAS